MLYIIICVAALAVSEAQFWNGLQVTAGRRSAGNQYPFSDVPRTTSEATLAGWEFLSSGCDGNYFLGQRWIRYDPILDADDHAVMPIYDVNGFIAGIQVGVPRIVPDSRPGYPTADITPPLVLDPSLDMWIQTAYFVDPAIVCTTGRSQADFDRQGTGDRVVLDMGYEFDTIPETVAGANATLWSYGKCFPGMGQHFWYNIRNDMSCDEGAPVFILYDQQERLDAFGWSFMGRMPGPRYERMTGAQIPAFFPDNFPLCMLDDTYAYSSIHVFLTLGGSQKRCD